MNKVEMIEFFHEFAKTSIIEDDDDYNLYGHSVLVTKIEEKWDVWLCNAKSRRIGRRADTLGARKLNNLLATVPEGVKVNKLDGEAWFQVSASVLKPWLRANRQALGIAVRRSAPPNAFPPQSV